jgi:hypothetical protein
MTDIKYEYFTTEELSFRKKSNRGRKILPKNIGKTTAEKQREYYETHRKYYQDKKRNEPKKTCEACDIEICASVWARHLKCKTHLILSEIDELKKRL